MQEMTGMRLEKLRGCAHEVLAKDTEDQLPLILENSGRKHAESRPVVVVSKSIDPMPTPYKDALLGIKD